jgi:secreted Zn-dependent insulinase-like peptidase
MQYTNCFKEALYAEEMKKLTKAELLEFYKEKLVAPASRRKVTLQVFGVNSPVPSAESAANTVVIPYGREHEFKSTMPFYPARAGSKL